MSCSRIIAVVIAVVCCSPAAVLAQGTKADYQRAEQLPGLLGNKLIGANITPGWSADGQYVWFQSGTAGDRARFMVIDTRTGERKPAFDQARVADALSRELGRPVDAGQLRGERMTVVDGVISVLVNVQQTPLLVRIKDGVITVHEPADATEFSITARPPQRVRSGSQNGRQVYVTFVNQTADPITMHWVNAQGERTAYATIQPGQSQRQHTFAGHAWVAVAQDGTDLAGFVADNASAMAVITGQVTARRGGRNQGRGNGPRTPGRNTSPDGRWQVLVRDHNVVAREIESGQEHQLTTQGEPDDSFGGRIYWSPDSRYCMVMQTRAGEDRRVYLIESSPDEQLQPLLHDYFYRKPGDRIPCPRPWLFDVRSQRAIEIDNTLFDNPWAINDIHWAADSSRVFFVYNQRGHQVMRLMAVDASSGAATAVITEHSNTFIDYSNKTFVQHIEDTDEVIWMSERSGWNHLYLVNRVTGDARPITGGRWVVRGVDDVDLDARQVRFRAMGIYPDQDPYHVHVARVDLDGSDLTMLSDGDGTHQIEFSPTGDFYVDTYSRVDLPPVHELRRTADGSLVSEMNRAGWQPLLQAGWTPPERFVAKARDGVTDIWGMIIRPMNFDPDRSYPIIEAIYAGPHGAHVPKSFRSYYREQSLAELGFIIVKIDGMGTNWRSKAFHDVCWKNIADAGFPDRKLWIRAAARKYPYMDTTRVGIYGGSAGGQNAMRALLDHHDLYDVAVADCGCHDNRMDKVWWNEAWMGWPVDESYARSSNVVDAHKLQGHLMLTVGEMDRNVDPASTMQVVDALIKADKDFDLIVFPGGGHGSGSGRYGTRRMRDFFVRHLYGVEPRQ